MKLRVYNFIEHTEALGPFKRFGLWVQGCPFRCRGCMTPESIPNEGGLEIETSKLAEYILSFENEGITISGGEPFMQSDALFELLNIIKSKKNLGVIIYSGYEYEEIKNNPLISLTDVLIDGRYVDELNDGVALRGSSNQKVYFLTDRYKGYEYMYESKNREVEVRISTFEVVGIPSKKFLERLKNGFHN